MKEAEDRLTCRVSGAVWLKKLTGDAQNDKKRAKPADLTEEKAAKKPKKAGASKAAKGKAKAKAKGAAPTLEDGETIDTLQADIQFQVAESDSLPAGSRSRMWLDDLCAAIMAVIKNCQSAHVQLELPAHGSSAQAGLIAVVVSCGLRFGLEGKAKLKKKVYKEWSKLRPALQSFLKQGLDTLSAQQKAALPQASSVQDLLSNLIQEVGASEAEQQLATLTTSANPQQAYAVAKEILADKESLQKVEKFIEKNNSHHCQQHLAYSTILKTIKESLCECPSPACNLHHDCHTLQDLLWGVHKSFMVLAEDEATTFCREIGLVGAACLVVGATVLQTVKNKQNSSSPGKGNQAGKWEDWAGCSSIVADLKFISVSCV